MSVDYQDWMLLLFRGCLVFKATGVFFGGSWSFDFGSVELLSGNVKYEDNLKKIAVDIRLNISEKNGRGKKGKKKRTIYFRSLRYYK